MDEHQFVTAIAECQNKADMENLLHQQSQFTACHVVPTAARNQRLDVLGKLFAFGTNKAHQLTAGHALKATLLRTLCKHHSLADMQSFEQILQVGFTTEAIYLNSSLAGLFAEAYTLTTMCTLLAYRDSDLSTREQFHLSKECLDQALRKFEAKCTQLHQSIIEHVSFHVGLTLELIQSDLWSPKEQVTVDNIIQTVQLCTQGNPLPEDRRTAEDNIVKKLTKTKLTKAEGCLLLHYFASVVHENPSTLNVCHKIFFKELDRSQGNLLKPGSKKLLFSCVVLFLNICMSVSHHGKY